MALRLRLFGIPIRIHVFFVVTAVLLWQIFGGAEHGWASLPIATLIVFQGVLMHELGHALVGRLFGLRPKIDLMAFWGLTSWEPGPDGTHIRNLSPGKLILISFAGPLVGLVIGGGALAALIALRPADPLHEWTLTVLVYVNLIWSLYNLLPILPLDGGNIMAAGFSFFDRTSGIIWARYASLFFIAGLLLFALLFQAIFLVLILGFFGYMNWQALRAERRLRDSGMLEIRTPEDALRVAYEALERGDGQVVSRCAVALLQGASEVAARDEALHLLAWGQLLMDEPAQARAALDRLSGERDADPALDGAVALALGRATASIVCFERALTLSGPSEFVEKRYVQAVETAGAFDSVVRLLEAHPSVLSARALSRLQAAALQAGALDASLALAERALAEGADPRAAFNAACAAARLGRAEESMDWLGRARDLGFDDVRLLDAEDDLASVREHADWPTLRARF